MNKHFKQIIRNYDILIGFLTVMVVILALALITTLILYFNL